MSREHGLCGSADEPRKVRAVKAAAANAPQARPPSERERIEREIRDVGGHQNHFQFMDHERPPKSVGTKPAQSAEHGQAHKVEEPAFMSSCGTRASTAEAETEGD